MKINLDKLGNIVNSAKTTDDWVMCPPDALEVLIRIARDAKAAYDQGGVLFGTVAGVALGCSLKEVE